MSYPEDFQQQVRQVFSTYSEEDICQNLIDEVLSREVQLLKEAKTLNLTKDNMKVLVLRLKRDKAPKRWLTEGGP
ncbi:hypothetical protein MATL_G00176260 [Megalops atlanticus]|uniref:Uncharacterized protein n=1 Tax=Megalops atlanticus TaxID=7932 RepID=A0A9D3T6S5_MEGAT|nr:hypothetical protein MATL_G00176260 [Megalops atlanticus]